MDNDAVSNRWPSLAFSLAFFVFSTTSDSEALCFRKCFSRRQPVEASGYRIKNKSLDLRPFTAYSNAFQSLNIPLAFEVCNFD